MALAAAALAAANSFGDLAGTSSVTPTCAGTVRVQNPPVSAAVAALFIGRWKELHSIADARKDYPMSESTAKRIISHYRATGEAREPRQGQGRTNDPRWVYAGPDGPANLAALEAIAQLAEKGD